MLFRFNRPIHEVRTVQLKKVKCIMPIMAQVISGLLLLIVTSYFFDATNT